MLVVVGAAELWLAWRRRDMASGRVVLGITVGSLAFLPWLPVFLYQSRHTVTGSPTQATFNLNYGATAPAAPQVSFDFTTGVTPVTLAAALTNLQNALDTIFLKTNNVSNAKAFISSTAGPVFDIFYTGPYAGGNFSNLTVSNTQFSGGSSPAVTPTTVDWRTTSFSALWNPIAGAATYRVFAKDTGNNGAY